MELDLAEAKKYIADKFTRNEILSPNEIRGIVGFHPSKDAAADELRNRNINQAKGNQNGVAEVPEAEGSGSKIDEALQRLNL